VHAVYDVVLPGCVDDVGGEDEGLLVEVVGDCSPGYTRGDLDAPCDAETGEKGRDGDRRRRERGRGREGERMCVCVCVCERERERETGRSHLHVRSRTAAHSNDARRTN
jgi:hypothetical protein